ncbi:GntR family transcriptional regulator [Erythrobacter sp.]|uniref:GntR family transcriptional regulator n=1 Tax=Erythrobacter sp. TaxID=1042 RepID=UPI002EC15E4A|nr:GntR family transcriptional regulator [Erythrobacter sp.]
MASRATRNSGKKAKRTPRYLQLAQELRAAILAGEFAGRSFPTETALCERFDVSRFTVREALRRLESEGLIARRRGSGTTVQPAAAHGGALHQPLSNVGELLQYARDSEVTYVEAGTGPLPAAVAEQMSVPIKGSWSRFRGIRRVSGEALPIATTDAYFHERLEEAVEQMDLSAGTLFSQIEKLAGIKVGMVTQDIQAIIADPAMASDLVIDEGSPVLRILRCYFDGKGDVFEISVSHHPGDRFAYAMHIDVDE